VSKVLDKLRPDPDLTRIVVNRSSRDGVRPGLIVLHTTEGSNVKGIRDLAGLAEFFDRSSTQASSHVANDSEGRDARLVEDHDKAWTCVNANPFTLNVEQIGFASTSRREWYELHSRQLANTAKWIAFWSVRWQIPIRRGAAPAGLLLRKGVGSHKQLGIMGGGHWDPGPSYPMRYVLWLARYFKLKVTAPDSRGFEKARRKVNRIRNHYGLEPLK
jgi:hypothetical protein